MPRAPIEDIPPPDEITRRERSAYVREHLRCPQCNVSAGWIGELTLVRDDADGRVVATNQSHCHTCGWEGLLDMLKP